MALESLRTQLAKLPGATPPEPPMQGPQLPKLSLSVAPPSSPTPASFSTNVAQSTPQSVAGPRGIALLNPLNPVTVRPLFAKAGQEQTLSYGGIPTALLHDLAARTIEGVTSIAYTTIANYREVQSRGNVTSVPVPFDASRLGLTDQAGQEFIQSTGARMVSKFDKLESENPGAKMNIAIAALSPMEDAINAFVAGDMLTSVAKQGLKATGYAPELTKALQQYGVQNLTGDALMKEFVRKFNLKATELIKAGDTAALNELGRATNTIVTYATGKGIPKLNRLGQLVQDISRVGLQDAKNGFTLKNPMYAEIAPEAPVLALPGTRVVPGQAPPIGMSTQAVERVGGTGKGDGPYYRSKDGGKTFEPVEEKNVMPAPIAPNLDTFVVKDMSGYSVIEGKSGMQIGSTEQFLTAAVNSAKEEVAQLGDKIDQFISSAPLSPRYTQATSEVTAPATVSEANKYGTKAAGVDNVLMEEARKYKTVDEFVRAIENTSIENRQTKNIPISKINTEFDIYKRDLPKAFEEIKGGTARKISNEPIRAYYNISTGKYDVIDGYHRLANALNTGKTEIKAGVEFKSNVSGNQTKSQLTDIYNRAHTEDPTKSITEKLKELPAKLKTSMPLKGDKSIKLNTADKMPKRIKPDKLKEMAQRSGSYKAFLDQTGITEEALQATVRKQGYENARAYYEINRPPVMPAEEAKSFEKPAPEQPDSEMDSLEIMAEGQTGSDFALQKSASEEDRIVSNLEQFFADIKGVDLGDIKKFTEQDLENARVNYELASDVIFNDPAAALQEYVVPAVGAEKSMREWKGVLPEVKGIPSDDPLRRTMHRNKREKFIGKDGKPYYANKQIIKPYIEWRMRGDDIADELGFADSEAARQAYESWKARKGELTAIYKEMREIEKAIRLSKQMDAFVGKEARKLATRLSGNLSALNNLVKAAERAGFRKGLTVGNKKYETIIQRLTSRRDKMNAIRRAFDLTNTEFQKLRRLPYKTKDGKTQYRDPDPRFMNKEEFDDYLNELQKAAEHAKKLHDERVIIEAIIDERGLRKTENLQRALELPPIKDMTLEQLFEFDEALSKTAPNDEFLGPRMIQTAVNTELGAIRTIGEGRAAVLKHTGMTDAIKDVEGSKLDRWMRDTTLAEKDPLHKMFITDWVAREADMQNRRHALKLHLDKLAGASRRSEKRSVMDRLAPQDEKVRVYAEASTGELAELEKTMTPEQIEFGKFARGFFQKYYQMVAEDAANRWTLRGVKYSRFKDMYFPHMTRSFFERWKDDGFVKGLKMLFDRNVADSKIDFNAFGDQGTVLGYEKFFKYAMRRGEGQQFSQNAASVMMAYFDSFERKLLLDSMIPKVKLYEFLFGKRFNTPKSINNPMGKEQVHSQLTKSLNEWLNNKKGQRIEMIYEQGDRIEAFVDTSSLMISLLDLGGNIITQTASAVGGELMTLRGAKFSGWALGHARALTKQGRAIARKNAGIIGAHPWHEIASATNDAGDTLTSSLFYLFGDLVFRAKRQMLLGLLTKEEFKTGVISAKRVAEIKLEIGKWHSMPDFRSVAGSTSLVKASSKYTEWATPAFQTAAMDLHKLIKAAEQAKKTGGTKGLKDFMNSDAFRNTMRTILVGIGAYVAAQLILQPDSKDKSVLGKLRYKAAREAGSIIQAVTGVGVFFNVRMLGFMQDLRDAVVTLATLDTYTTNTQDHKAGDLKAPSAFMRLFTPALIKQFQKATDTSKPVAAPATGTSADAALKRLNKLKNPAVSNPGLKKLDRLKKQLGR